MSERDPHSSFEYNPFERPETPPPKSPPRADWRENLRLTEEGKLMAVFTNLVEIFQHKEFWQDPAIHPQSPYFDTPGSRFAYNEMTDTPCILLEPMDEHGKTVRGTYKLHSLLADHENWFSWVRHTLGRVHRIDPDKFILWDAIMYMAKQRSVHPVREYLRSVVWDGAPRLTFVAQEILRLKHPTSLQRRMLALWMISCVARAFSPGCKVDTVLVLHGDQGLYKSTFFDVLGGPWFVDSPMNLENKDAFQLMAESWIYEWGEIGKLTRHRQAEVIKAFVTSREDTYRAPYERKPGRHPRSMVFVGTTNEDEFLVDRENRRFWVLPVTEPVNVTLLREWRDQLWAEAVAAYDQGPVDGRDPWVLRDDERESHAASLESFRPQDPWYGPIRDFADRHAPTEKKPGLSMKEILGGALQLDLKDFDKARQMRVSEILRELGYRRAQFGKDRVWLWVRK